MTRTLFAVTFLGTLIVGWGAPVNSWLVFNLGLFMLWTPVLIIPHEVAHAAVARAVGLRVFFLEIGSGPAVFETRLGGTRLSIHAIPVSGRTAFASQARNWQRARPFAAILAGPALHLLLAACPIAMLGWDGFEGRVWNTQFFHSPTPWSAFVFANLALFVRNTIPHSSARSVPPMPSDGARLIRLLSDPDGSRTEYLVGYFQLEGLELLREVRYEDAIETFEQGLREHPGSLHLRVGRALVDLKSGRPEEARSAFLSLLDSPEIQGDDLQRSILENNVAYCDVLIDGHNPGALDRADELSRQAVARYPSLAAMLSTRGAVLIRQGHPKESIEPLERASRLSADLDGQCITAAWLAVAYAQTGETDRAHRWLARAGVRPTLHEFRMAEAEVLQPPVHDRPDRS